MSDCRVLSFLVSAPVTVFNRAVAQLVMEHGEFHADRMPETALSPPGTPTAGAGAGAGAVASPQSRPKELIPALAILNPILGAKGSH